jgi:hypothetical protein
MPPGSTHSVLMQSVDDKPDDQRSEDHVLFGNCAVHAGAEVNHSDIHTTVAIAVTHSRCKTQASPGPPPAPSRKDAPLVWLPRLSRRPLTTELAPGCVVGEEWGF